VLEWGELDARVKRLREPAFLSLCTSVLSLRCSIPRISFYGGGPRERDILWRAYLRLVKHINSIYKVHIVSIIKHPD